MEAGTSEGGTGEAGTGQAAAELASSGRRGGLRACMDAARSRGLTVWDARQGIWCRQRIPREK